MNSSLRVNGYLSLMYETDQEKNVHSRIFSAGLAPFEISSPNESTSVFYTTNAKVSAGYGIELMCFLYT